MGQISYLYFINKDSFFSHRTGFKIKANAEKVAVCAVKMFNFDKACSPIEKRYIMTAILPNAIGGLWKGETNVSSFVETMSSRVAAKKVVKRNISASVKEAFYFQIETFNGTAITKLHFSSNSSQSESLFSSPVFNVTGQFENEEKRKTRKILKSITISSIYDSTRPQYVFNRTFDLYSRSDLTHHW